MSDAQQAAFAAKMAPGETPLWVGQPRVGGLRLFALVPPVAVLVAGLIWTVNTGRNFFSADLPGDTTASITRYFIAFIAPRLVVFLGLPALYLIAAFWLLKRSMRATHYLITDRAAYVASGTRAPGVRRYDASTLRRRDHWFTGTDLLLHFPPARMGAKGMYKPAPEGFKRLIPDDTKAALHVLEPLRAAAIAQRSAVLETLSKARQT